MNSLNIKRPNLDYHWKAEFEDGKILYQFDKDKENLFKEVRDNFNKLNTFILYHISKPFKIIVDLKKGLIYFNDVQVTEPDLLKKKDNIRLIYFRRNKVHFNEKFEQTGHDIIYFIGYQYTNNGKNKKVILQVDKNQYITIGD